MKGRPSNNKKVEGSKKNIKLPEKYWEYLRESGLNYREAIAMLVKKEMSEKVYFKSELLIQHFKDDNYYVSRSPDFIILPSGEKVRIDRDVRKDSEDSNYNDKDLGILISKSKYCPIIGYPQIEFWKYSSWVDDASSSGHRIKWRVPKGSTFIWCDRDHNQTPIEDEIVKEEKV